MAIQYQLWVIALAVSLAFSSGLPAALTVAAELLW
jgi:hypothetical protein